jgi:ATP-dependent DNA ligase
VNAAELLRLGFALVVGWTDLEGSRPYLGRSAPRLLRSGSKAAGRVGTGIDTAELQRLWRKLQPLATAARMPLDALPARSTCFGPPLVLSRVHRVRPELVVEVKFLAWTEDNLLRQAVYKGLREDKPAAEVRREMTHAKP